jgi:hypothetical protein
MANLKLLLVGAGIAALTYYGVSALKPISAQADAAFKKIVNQPPPSLPQEVPIHLANIAKAGAWLAATLIAFWLLLVFGTIGSVYLFYRGWFVG